MAHSRRAATAARLRLLVLEDRTVRGHLPRPDVPVASVITEYVDVAHAFFDKRESGFVNGLLDAIAKEARPARTA